MVGVPYSEVHLEWISNSGQQKEPPIIYQISTALVQQPWQLLVR